MTGRPTRRYCSSSRGFGAFRGATSRLLSAPASRSKSVCVAGDSHQLLAKLSWRDREPARRVRPRLRGQGTSLAGHRRGRLLRQSCSVVEHALARLVARPARRAGLSRGIFANVVGRLLPGSGRLLGCPDDRAVAAATMDRARPGVGHAARDDLAGRRLLDAQSDRGRHGTIGPGGRSGPRHPERDAPSGNVGDRVVGGQPSDRQWRSEFAAVFRRRSPSWRSAARC